MTAVPEPSSDRPFDTGLQPERTALAWRRTSLSLTVGALVGVRVLPEFWGAWGLIVGGVGVVLSLAVLLPAHRRCRAQHQCLTSGQPDRPGLPDGALPALLAATCLAAGLTAMLLAVDIWVRRAPG